MNTEMGRGSSQTEAVYQAIRAAILGVEIRPGDPVTERWLEGLVAASRTPIRTALARLEAEGLVQRRGRGYIASPIDLAEMEQAYVFRETLEVAAIRLAAARREPVDWAAVDALTNPAGDMPNEEWFEVGMAFHVEIARLSGNEFFVRAVADVMTRLSRGRWLEIGSAGGRDRALREHASVVAHIRSGNADAAADELRAHIHHSRDRLLKVLRSQQKGLAVRGFRVVNA
ncbi:GntR family transcriptional regulator [Azospirillum canadense]|uniref:GntR family transcriptional regulator n=1 Tax=Azospirillum canadense TaxID=403962 RepID=UPI0022267FDD|nr:GntR family transcriptional regulator [Azospirillum canadense]MCW2240505.1 DNA-binding GntR family transcriptional regulator [Azospirillum canadense]